MGSNRRKRTHQPRGGEDKSSPPLGLIRPNVKKTASDPDGSEAVGRTVTQRPTRARSSSQDEGDVRKPSRQCSAASTVGERRTAPEGPAGKRTKPAKPKKPVKPAKRAKSKPAKPAKRS